jgi:hypothetical protein
VYVYYVTRLHRSSHRHPPFHAHATRSTRKPAFALDKRLTHGVSSSSESSSRHIPSLHPRRLPPHRLVAPAPVVLRQLLQMLQLLQHLLHESNDLATSLGARALSMRWHCGGRTGLGARVSLWLARGAGRGLLWWWWWWCCCCCCAGGWCACRSVVVPRGDLDVGFPIARGARGVKRGVGSARGRGGGVACRCYL